MNWFECGDGDWHFTQKANVDSKLIYASLHWRFTIMVTDTLDSLWQNCTKWTFIVNWMIPKSVNVFSTLLYKHAFPKWLIYHWEQALRDILLLVCVLKFRWPKSFNALKINSFSIVLQTVLCVIYFTDTFFSYWGKLCIYFNAII